MEKEDRTRRHLTVDALEQGFDIRDSFGIGAGLGAQPDVVQPSESMGPAKDPQTAVFPRAFVQGDKRADHPGKDKPLAIPVSVVLVPLPRAAFMGVFEHHLAVEEGDLLAQKYPDIVDNAGTRGNRGPDVVSQFVPDRQPGRLSRCVRGAAGILRHPRARFNRLEQDADFVFTE